MSLTSMSARYVAKLKEADARGGRAGAQTGTLQRHLKAEPPPVAPIQEGLQEKVVPEAAGVAGGAAGANAGAAGSSGVGVNSAVGAIASDISNYVPTETIAVYLAAVSLLPAGATCGSTFGILLTMLILGALVSPFIILFMTMRWARAQGIPYTGAPIFSMAASAVAFIAWANYLPSSLGSRCFSETPAVAGVALIIAQFAIYIVALGLDAFGVANVSITEPSVSPDERAGIIASTNGAEPRNTSTPGIGDGKGPVTNLQHAPVISPAQIYPCFLGAAWDGALQGTQGTIITFLDALITSPNFSWLQAYGVTAANRQQPQTFALDVTLPMPLAAATVIEPAFATLSTQLRAAGNSNAVILAFLPPNVSVTQTEGVVCDENGGGSCGYHQKDRYGTTYALIPFVSDQWCQDCKVKSASAIDGSLSALTHELCEALTNPDPYNVPAWRSLIGPDYEEIADICQGTMTSIGGHTVQAVWINDSSLPNQGSCKLSS